MPQVIGAAPIVVSQNVLALNDSTVAVRCGKPRTTDAPKNKAAEAAFEGRTTGAAGFIS